MAKWTAAEEAAKAKDFDQTLGVIAQHTDAYQSLLGDMSDADFRAESICSARRPRAAPSSSTWCSAGVRRIARSCFSISKPAAGKSSVR